MPYQAKGSSIRKGRAVLAACSGRDQGSSGVAETEEGGPARTDRRSGVQDRWKADPIVALLLLGAAEPSGSRSVLHRTFAPGGTSSRKVASAETSRSPAARIIP